MNIGQGQEWFLGLLLALLSLGILLGEAFPLPLPAIAVPFALLLPLSLSLACRESSHAWIAFALLFLALGMLRYETAAQLPASDISHFAGQNAAIEGVLREAPRITEEGDGIRRMRYLVDVRSIRLPHGEVRAASGGIYVYASQQAGEKDIPSPNADGGTTPQIGDLLRASGKIRLPHAYQNPGQLDTVLLLRCQGITAQLMAGKQGAHIEHTNGYAVLRLMADIRSHYLSSMQSVMPKEDAAAIFAMLFGGYEGIRPELLNAFTVTGIVHILSVSGSHISLLAAATAGLGALLRLPRLIVSLLVLFAIAIYSILSGCVPPVIRSAIMGGLAFFALALDREKESRRILLLTGFGMLLWSPLLFFHISFQLSFCATAGLLYIAPKIREQLDAFPPFFSMSLAITIGAQLSTMPILAWYFNQLSISSLLSNLIVVPIVECMIGLGLAAGVLGLLLPFLAKAVFLFDSLLLGLVYELTRMMARLPGSMVYFPTMGLWSGTVWYAALLFWLQPEERKRAACRFLWERRRWALLPSILLAVFAGGWRWMHPPELAVHFIDVGQGDACLVLTPHGHAVMIDTGGTRGDFDVGARVDVPYLLHYGVRSVDYILLTHAHEDHAAGAGAVLRSLPVGRVLIGDEGVPAYARSMRFPDGAPELRRLVRAREGDRIMLDGVSIDILYAPDAEGGADSGNEASNVYRISYGKASFLLTGDLVAENEKRLLEKHPDLRSTVLKAGHHGSNTSSSPEFVAAVAPQWTVFCVGADNSFGHPKPEILKRFRESGSNICRTDEDGAIVFHTDGQRMRVETYRKK